MLSRLEGLVLKVILDNRTWESKKYPDLDNKLLDITNKMSGNNPSWRSTEIIAALVEKAISPGAIVTHNVHLPVIGSSRTRQCDVVITFGEKPRQSIAIVEVQKRKKKPDINTFHGWLQKMREVGAQQLFCVSMAGYPNSIIEEVAQRVGPSVKLLTFKDLDDNDALRRFFLVPIWIHTTPKFEITDIGSMSLLKAPAELTFELNTSDKCFSIDEQPTVVSFNELIAAILNQTKPIEPPALHEPLSIYPITIVLDDSASRFWFHHGALKLLIKKWKIQLQVYFEREQNQIPTSHFTYHQEFLDGALAWIGTTKFTFENKEQEVCIVATPESDGQFTIRAWRQ